METVTPYSKIEELSHTFGKRLKERREEAGLNVTDLVRRYNIIDSNRCGSLSRSTIYEYEGAKAPLRTPKLSTVIILANVLGVSVEWLLGFSEVKFPHKKGPVQVTLSRKQINKFNKFLSLSEKQSAFLDKVLSLPDEQQQLIMKMINNL